MKIIAETAQIDVGCINCETHNHAMRTVNMLRDCDFENLHTDLQSVSFLALVKAVKQRTQEIVSEDEAQ